MALSRSLLGIGLVSLSLSFAALGDGTLTVNGKTVKLDHAYATTRPDPFDKKKTVTLVLFTDRELPANALKDDFTLMDAQSKTKFSGVSAEIDSDKQVISGQIYSSALKNNMDQFSSTGSQKVELTTRTASRIAGKLYLPEPGDFFKNTYMYSIDFDVPIVTAAQIVAAMPKPKGTPLPANGGDQWTAYQSYRKVIKSGDLTALKKMVTSEQAKQVDDPDFKKFFPLMQQMQPKNVKFLNGVVDGDNATLNVSAKDGKESSTGTIEMIRDGGKWKVKHESWQSKSE